MQFLRERQGYYDVCVVAALKDLELYCNCQSALSASCSTALIIYDDLFEQSRKEAEVDRVPILTPQRFKKISSLITNAELGPSVPEELFTKIFKIKPHSMSTGLGMAQAIRRLLEMGEDDEQPHPGPSGLGAQKGVV